MIDLSDEFLMMIEPQEAAEEPIEDRITEMARTVGRAAVASDHVYKGHHTCMCGATSDNRDWVLPGGVVTNSLMIHYVECHRREVPTAELLKLQRIYEGLKFPTEEPSSAAAEAPAEDEYVEKFKKALMKVKDIFEKQNEVLRAVSSLTTLAEQHQAQLDAIEKRLKDLEWKVWQRES